MTGDKAKPQQLPFDLGHRTAFARDDFWVSGCNSDAVAWLDKYPDWPAPLLFVYGPRASGKTHLLKIWQNETGGAVFDAANIDSLPPAVIIDDIDKLVGDSAREEALFHLYNIQKERGGHILAAAETPPRGWRFVLRDLESRFLAAPAVAVGSPDDELMAVVLTKLFSDRQIFVPQEVVQFLLPRLQRSFAAMRDVVADIDHKALAEKRKVTVPLVREIFDSAQQPLV
ncbi:MAG TPA: DnaA/Hda family protein [Alphaproteobacteria bacterium]|nr:DnaA/Hda family protein [Alphaproteobacteria bacterium]